MESSPIEQQSNKSFQLASLACALCAITGQGLPDDIPVCEACPFAVVTITRSDIRLPELQTNYSLLNNNKSREVSLTKMLQNGDAQEALYLG